MGLLDDIKEKKKQIENTLKYMEEEIVSIDASKELYDSAIRFVDEKLVSQIDAVNQSISNVQTAYEDRIVSGCRTDVFWRVVGITTTITPGVDQYTLIATQISLNGYAGIGTTQPTGIGTVLSVLDSSGGITTYRAADATVGLTTDNLHGLKYIAQPITKDIGDTTVGSFIGTVGTGSTVLTVMTPYSTNILTDFKIGMTVQCSKVGVFGLTVESTNTIVGFSSAVSDLSGITTNPTSFAPGAGIGLTVVPIILLETPSSGIASAPESDGKFVTFTVLKDPIGFTTYNEYAIEFGTHPFSPETIGIMNGDNLGIGISLFYDNSGISSNPQSWKPEYAISGYTDMGIPDVVAPPVGADHIFYKTAFDNRPVYLGNPALIGDTVSVTNISSGLYQSLSSCASTITDALNSAITIRDNLESELASGIGSFNKRISATNALRKERDDEYNARIYGLRTAIGAQVEELARYNTLVDYIEQEGLE